MDIESLLLSVEKPSRYMGGEVNSVRKDHRACKLSFALAFPDTYEVGMSHLGCQILYAILNGMPEVIAERCFAPWPDMESKMRQNNISLTSLESRTAIRHFDVVGFSLQYELSYTNVLNMLDLAHIPLHREERRDDDPLILAGGPCTFNPAPMSPFIDVFAIGEGEELIAEIAAAIMAGKEKGHRREQILEDLAQIESLYVPSVHRSNKIIRKRTVADLNLFRFPDSPIVPLMKTIHDRITLEIARGCTRGCRFCQAGMVWRPVRERNPDTLMQMAERNLRTTGCDEISLLSLSSGDYTRIESLMSALIDRYYDDRIALSLPSLRVETLTAALIDRIKQIRKTSFTLAPEAGTQRLRDIINKGNTEEELLATIREVFKAGWKTIKLYFMLGLPEERDDDLEGIVDLASKALREGKNRGSVTISLSTFVPKPHTPFQWRRQITMEETKQKQDYFYRSIRNRRIAIKWHDSRMSFLEGILSRGDERTGQIVEEAFRQGARFDGWGDLLRFHCWEEPFLRRRFPRDDYLQERNPSAALPWDFIDTGVSRNFLLQEEKKALTQELTPDCRLTACHHCGVCDHRHIKTRTAFDLPNTLPDDRKAKNPPETKEEKYRLLFGKKNQSRFLSHLEVSSALVRALRQGGFKFIFSQGFHPLPRISFATATAVGMESLSEYADIRIVPPPSDIFAMIGAANKALPQGMVILNAERIPPSALALSEIIQGFSYEVRLKEFAFPVQEIHNRIHDFLLSSSCIITKKTGEKIKTKDIRPFVEELMFDTASFSLQMQIKWLNNGALNPCDLLPNIFPLSADELRKLHIIKTDTLFKK
ncbi:MAG: TIGR03960 family B12-binding radical SAM protein [Syntrophobacterales bacterium]|jgi:radical SAM family uncharacterized protein/radical SAM-linked protein|nr:TIGR03960 family B12-binding radical SAM protein [Syntrophobacterales bacterium]